MTTSIEYYSLLDMLIESLFKKMKREDICSNIATLKQKHKFCSYEGSQSNRKTVRIFRETIFIYQG